MPLPFPLTKSAAQAFLCMSLPSLLTRMKLCARAFRVIMRSSSITRLLIICR